MSQWAPWMPPSVWWEPRKCLATASERRPVTRRYLETRPM